MCRYWSIARIASHRSFVRPSKKEHTEKNQWNRTSCGGWTALNKVFCGLRVWAHSLGIGWPDRLAVGCHRWLSAGHAYEFPPSPALLNALCCKTPAIWHEVEQFQSSVDFKTNLQLLRARLRDICLCRLWVYHDEGSWARVKSSRDLDQLDKHCFHPTNRDIPYVCMREGRYRTKRKKFNLVHDTN